MNVIEVNNVWKKFKIPHEKRDTLFENVVGFIRGGKATYEEFWALKNINFNVKEGECLGIIGENGSGKSTLLRVIARILSIDKGNVNVRGSIGPFLELGTGFQRDLTAKENVYLYGYVIGLKKKQIDNVIDNIFEFAELERFRDTKLKNFSSGMNMRLAFSTAVSTNPDILLIDEVLAVGDESFQKKCIDKIMKFKSEGKTIVFVSHSLESVKNLCNKGVWLSRGTIGAQGSVDKVISYYMGLVREKEEDILEREHVEVKEEIGNRWGSREIEITDVKFFNNDGKECYVFETGDKMVIKIKYDAHKKIKKPIFGVAIHRNDGIHVSGPNTKFQNRIMEFLEGNGEVECVIDSLPLLEGTYLFSAAVYDYACTFPYDHHEKRFSFKVKSNINDYGIVYLPCEWKYTEQ